MEKQPTLTLQFSKEEMLYMISILRLGTLPGMADHPIEEYPEEERPAVLRAGFNSLQARKLISYDAHTKTASLDTLLLALFSTCSSPQATIYVGRVPVDAAPTTIYYHRREKLVVRHLLAGSQIHAMTAYFDLDSVRETVQAELIRGEWKEYPFPDVEIEATKFDELLKDLLAENLNSATKICVESGLSDNDAVIVVRCLQSMQANATIAVTQFDQKHNVSKGEIYAWIEIADGVIRVETVDRRGQEFVRLSVMPSEWEIPVHALFISLDE